MRDIPSTVRDSDRPDSNVKHKLSGDIGGFGVGSDFAWQGLVTFRWPLTERTGALAAYRYMDVDYESGNGSNRFKYDMVFSGPALGIVFTF